MLMEMCEAVQNGFDQVLNNQFNHQSKLAVRVVELELQILLKCRLTTQKSTSYRGCRVKGVYM